MKHLIVELTVSALTISLLIIACSKDKTANKIPAAKTSISARMVGEYESHDNTLTISKVEENKMTFQLLVVQVISGFARTGEIQAIAELSKNKAIWKDTDPQNFVDGQPAQLTFIFLDGQVKVTGENTSTYGGLGVSFDGTYQKKADVEP